MVVEGAERSKRKRAARMALRASLGTKKGGYKGARPKPRGKSGRAAARRRQSAVGSLRRRFDMTVRDFAHLTGFSVRAVQGWDHGEPMSQPARIKMRELSQLWRQLCDFMKPSYVPVWLRTPNPRLRGMTPADAIAEGYADKVWRLVYAVNSDVAT